MAEGVDRELVGVDPGFDAHVLRLCIQVGQAQGVRPDQTGLEREFVGEVVAQDLELPQVVDQVGSPDAHSGAHAPVGVEGHHDVVLVAEVALSRPVGGDGVEVGRLDSPVSVDHDLLEADIQRGRHRRLEAVGRDPALAVERPAHAVDDVGLALVAGAGAQRRVRAVRARPQRAVQADQMQGSEGRAQPHHVEPRGRCRRGPGCPGRRAPQTAWSLPICTSTRPPTEKATYAAPS